MAQYAKYPLPHLLGQIDYQRKHNFDPDGDTIHLLNPVLLTDGHAVKPKNGKLTIWMPGNLKPRKITLKGKNKIPYAPIRLEGIDAPEEHYRATPFKLKKGGTVIPIGFDANKQHDERSQPKWKPATDYLIKKLEKTGWALISLDREVVDSHGRVLGYVYASDSQGNRGLFVSLQLVKKGLAFPFLFESGGELIPQFLAASSSARKNHRGVWKNYVEGPLPYSATFARPSRYTNPEPSAQSNSQLNLPVVFRRVVDSYQLKGLSLSEALRKYDAIDYETGDLVSGDLFQQIPIDRRIWAPHRYDT